MDKSSIFKWGLPAGLIVLMVLLAGCAPTWVKSATSLCIQVKQSYPGVSGHSEPIAEELQGILERMGLQVTSGAGTACQANLALNLEFTPITEPVVGHGDCYLDASMSGQAILSSKGHLPAMMSLVHPKATHTGFGVRLVYSCPKDPAKAPYDTAWTEPVVIMLRKWWGAPALMSALKSQVYGVRSYAVYQLAETGPEAIPVLTGLLADSSEQNRANAAKALGTFGAAAKTAVPALIGLLDDQSYSVSLEAVQALGAIGPDARAAVPKLIQILENKQSATSSYAPSALVKITGKYFGADAAAWRKWYDSQP
jgi:hypothetical protein